MRHLRTLKFPARTKPLSSKLCRTERCVQWQHREVCPADHHRKVHLAGKEIKQAADMAACMSSDKRHLPREQNPALLSCCQYFLAIELFSSGAES